MMKPCPVTGKMIPRRYAVSGHLLASLLASGDVKPNPNGGSLRRLIYVGAKKK